MIINCKLVSAIAAAGLTLLSTELFATTKITIGTVNNSDMIRMQQLSSEFKQVHPDIDINWVTFDENNLRKRLNDDILSEKAHFDVVTIGMYEAPIWGRNGWLAQIEQLPSDYDLTDIFPSIISGLSSENALYALPFYAESSMTYYRKDLFKAKRMRMPRQPTWEQIKSFAQSLHQPDAEQYGICLRGKAGWGENMALITTISNTFGGRWFDGQWQSELSSPEWQKSVNFYVDLLTRFGPPKPSSNGFNENLNLFKSGKCAIWVDATVAGSFILDSTHSEVPDNVGFALAPKQVTNKGAGWLWSWALAIPATSKAKEAARKFIVWATSKQYVQLVAEKYGIVNVPPGTRSSTYDNPLYIQSAPFAATTLESMIKANPEDATLKPAPYRGIQFAAIPEFESIGTYTGELISRALGGALSVEDALAKAALNSNEIMKVELSSQNLQ